MTTVTQAAFAKSVGVSRKTVTMWKARGWLVMDDDLVDVEKSTERLKKYRTGGVPEPVTKGDKGNKPAKAGARRPAGKVTPAVPPAPAAPASAKPPGGEESLEAKAERILSQNGALWDMDEAKRVKESYLALLNQLEYEEKSGALVSMEVAKSVLFSKAREFRDALINWPASAGPRIAADLDLEADRVTEILTAHVHTLVASLGEPEGTFQ